MPNGLVETAVPIVGSLTVIVVGWLLNERSKRNSAAYQRRERRYRNLLDAFRGFYEGEAGASDSHRLRQRFLDEMTMAWLYCPDEAIRSGYAFLATLKLGAVHTAAERDAAAKRFVAALRRDLVGRTSLGPEEFLIASVRKRDN
ncbi:MAG: hypothetical protein WD830_02435 [Chloroflexota bacterium]